MPSTTPRKLRQLKSHNPRHPTPSASSPCERDMAGSRSRTVRRRSARSPAPTRSRVDSEGDIDPAPVAARTHSHDTSSKQPANARAPSVTGVATDPEDRTRLRKELGMPAWRQAVYLLAVVASTAAVAHIGTKYLRDRESGAPQFIVAHVPFFFLLMGECAICVPELRLACCRGPVTHRGEFTSSLSHAAVEAALGSGYFTVGGKYHTPDSISSIAAGSYQTMWGVLVLKQLGYGQCLHSAWLDVCPHVSTPAQPYVWRVPLPDDPRQLEGAGLASRLVGSVGTHRHRHRLWVLLVPPGRP